MSSARIAPIPRSPRSRSQPCPRSWNGKSGCVIAAGVPSGSKLPLVAAGEQRPEAVVERDLAELEPGVLELDARDGPDEVDDGSLAAAIEEEQRPLDLGAAQRVPAARGSGSAAPWRRRARSSSSSVSVVSPIASFQSNRASASVVEQAARAAGHARRGEVDAQPAGGRDPVARQQHRHAELLEPRDRRRGGRSERRRRRARSSSARPGRTRARRRRGRARSARAGGARRSADRPSGGSRRPRRRRRAGARWGGRGSDRRPPAARARARRGSSAPSSDPAAVALVEAQAEEPRRARAALEATVDPVGEPPLERPEAGVRRQLGLGRGEAVEKELGRARPAAREPVAEPDARRAEAVAGDLVDGTGVEVVDECVAVAVERVGADRRQRGGDRVERLLHRLVDRRAPVGEPGAAAVLQLRVERAPP